MRIDGIVDPVAHGFVGSIFQGLATRRGRNNRGTQHPHPVDIRLLPLHVDAAHVHNAFQAHQGANRSRCHAVLTGTRFGNDAFFAEPLRDQNLTNGVIDFMRSGMAQVFPLQVDSCPNLRR